MAKAKQTGKKSKNSRKTKVSMNIIKELLDGLLKKYSDIVKAIWVISPKDLLSKKPSIVVVLIDDTKAKEKDIKQLEVDAIQLSEKLEQKYEKKIYFDFELLTHYFEKVMQDRIDTFIEIKHALALYDPTGFLRPLQLLVEKGKILGTKESILRLIINVKSRMKDISKIKVEALAKIYEAVIDAAEAALIAWGYAALTPKYIAVQLDRIFVKKHKLSKRFVDYYKAIYDYYKQYEHDKIKVVDGAKLDELIKKADAFIDRMKELIEEAPHRQV